MSFDPRSVEARLSLGLVLPEDIPAVAWQALEAGWDGPTIRRVAGLENPSGWETDQLLPRFMREAGMNLLPLPEASVRVAYDKAREILDCQLDPLGHLRFFEQLWIKADHPSALRELGWMDDQVYVARECYLQPEKDVRKTVRDALIDFTRDFEARAGSTRAPSGENLQREPQVRQEIFM